MNRFFASSAAGERDSTERSLSRKVSAGFTVAAQADAADVSMRLRERGWIAYRLRLDTEQHAWVATVIDWTRRAA